LEIGDWRLEIGDWILDFGFWILDFGFWILDFSEVGAARKFQIQNFKYQRRGKMKNWSLGNPGGWNPCERLGRIRQLRCGRIHGGITLARPAERRGSYLMTGKL
jgi:hypothetical protein